MDYTYTIDLRDQDTTPSYKVSYTQNGALINYPANSMPHLKIDDTLTFNFQSDKDTSVSGVNLYIRAIVTSEANSPFSPQDTIVYPIAQGSKLTVVANNGLWTFSILGMLTVPNLAGSTPISIPFFIDPDMDVGTGVPP